MHELIWSIRESLMHHSDCQPADADCAGDGTAAATYYVFIDSQPMPLSAQYLAEVLGIARDPSRLRSRLRLRSRCTCDSPTLSYYLTQHHNSSHLWSTGYCGWALNDFTTKTGVKIV